MPKHIYSLIAIFVVILLVMNPKPVGYEYLFFQPLLFFLLYEINTPFKKYKYSYISLTVLFVVAFIRYVISPFFLCLGEYPAGGTNNLSSLYTANVLMCYEEVVFFITVHFWGNKHVVQNFSHRDYNNLIPLKPSAFLISIILLSVSAILIMPSIVERYHFVFALTGEEDYGVNDLEHSSLNTLFGLILNSTRYIVILLFFSFFHGKYKREPKKIYVLFCLFLIAVNSIFVYDLSRFNVIIPALILTFVLMHLFPRERKSIIKGALIMGIVVLGTITVAKMFNETRGQSIDDSRELVSWANILQTYFMGVREVSSGVFYAESKLAIFGILSLFNDIISNTMILSKLSLRELTSIVQYNMIYSGGVSIDKIMPNVSAGYLYFGELLSPSITVFFTALSIWFEKKSVLSRKIQYVFINQYSSLICSLVMMQFFSMIIGTLFNYVFFLYIILKANEIFSPHKK